MRPTLLTLAVASILLVAGCRGERSRSLDPEVVASVERLEFSGWVGHAAARTLVVTNRSKVDALVIASVGRPFSVVPELRIPGGASIPVAIQVTMESQGAVEAVLELAYDDERFFIPVRYTSQVPPPCLDASPCQSARFDPETGMCEQRPRADGAACADTCIEQGACRSGACVGTARTCDDGNACTADACNASQGCVHVDISSSCTAPQGSCLVGVCHPQRGCETETAPDGTLCGEVRCTRAETCVAGTCSERPVPLGAYPSDTLCALEVGSGDYYSCALLVDGRVTCWGILDGEIVPLPGPLPSPPKTSAKPVVVKVPEPADRLWVGKQLSCARGATTRRVYCFGLNQYKMMWFEPLQPDWMFIPFDAPVEAPPEFHGADEMNLHSHHSMCAVHIDAGTLTCTKHHIGEGSEAIKPKVIPGLPPIQKVALPWSEIAFYGLDRDGGIWTWGAPSVEPCSMHPSSWNTCWQELPTPFSKLSTAVKDLAASAKSGCAILVDGQVACWGDNIFGLQGNLPWSNAFQDPHLVPGLTDIIAITMGFSMGGACALRNDGRVLCWGSNFTGHPGLTTSHVPAVVPDLSNVDEISLGAWHACGIRDGYSVFCWGWNVYGEAGVESADGGYPEFVFPPTDVRWDATPGSNGLSSRSRSG